MARGNPYRDAKGEFTSKELAVYTVSGGGGDPKKGSANEQTVTNPATAQSSPTNEHKGRIRRVATALVKHIGKDAALGIGAAALATLASAGAAHLSKRYGENSLVTAAADAANRRLQSKMHRTMRKSSSSSLHASVGSVAAVGIGLAAAAARNSQGVSAAKEFARGTAGHLSSSLSERFSSIQGIFSKQHQESSGQMVHPKGWSPMSDLHHSSAGKVAHKGWKSHLD